MIGADESADRYRNRSFPLRATVIWIRKVCFALDATWPVDATTATRSFDRTSLYIHTHTHILYIYIFLWHAISLCVYMWYERAVYSLVNKRARLYLLVTSSSESRLPRLYRQFTESLIYTISTKKKGGGEKESTGRWIRPRRWRTSAVTLSLRRGDTTRRLIISRLALIKATPVSPP